MQVQKRKLKQTFHITASALYGESRNKRATINAGMEIFEKNNPILPKPEGSCEGLGMPHANTFFANKYPSHPFATCNEV